MAQTHTANQRVATAPAPGPSGMVSATTAASAPIGCTRRASSTGAGVLSPSTRCVTVSPSPVTTTGPAASSTSMVSMNGTVLATHHGEAAPGLVAAHEGMVIGREVPEHVHDQVGPSRAVGLEVALLRRAAVLAVAVERHDDAVGDRLPAPEVQVGGLAQDTHPPRNDLHEPGGVGFCHRRVRRPRRRGTRSVGVRPADQGEHTPGRELSVGVGEVQGDAAVVRAARRGSRRTDRRSSRARSRRAPSRRPARASKPTTL